MTPGSGVETGPSHCEVQPRVRCPVPGRRFRRWSSPCVSIARCPRREIAAGPEIWPVLSVTKPDRGRGGRRPLVPALSDVLSAAGVRGSAAEMTGIETIRAHGIAALAAHVASFGRPPPERVAPINTPMGPSAHGELCPSAASRPHNRRNDPIRHRERCLPGDGEALRRLRISGNHPA